MNAHAGTLPLDRLYVKAMPEAATRLVGQIQPHAGGKAVLPSARAGEERCEYTADILPRNAAAVVRHLKYGFAAAPIKCNGHIAAVAHRVRRATAAAAVDPGGLRAVLNGVAHN